MLRFVRTNVVMLSVVMLNVVAPLRRVQYLMGENLKVVCAKFSTLSWAVLLHRNLNPWRGATTHSITTLSITTLSIMTLSITTFSITITKSQHSP
jgi:hypothetical protein